MKLVIAIICLFVVNKCFGQSFNKQILIGKWHNEDSMLVTNLIFVDSIHMDMELILKPFDNYNFQKKDRYIDTAQFRKITSPKLRCLYVINSTQGCNFRLNFTEIDRNKSKTKDEFVLKCTLKSADLLIVEMTYENATKIMSFTKSNSPFSNIYTSCLNKTFCLKNR